MATTKKSKSGAAKAKSTAGKYQHVRLGQVPRQQLLDLCEATEEAPESTPQHKIAWLIGRAHAEMFGATAK